MIIEVMNKSRIEEYAKHVHGERVIVISISSHANMEARISKSHYNGILDICFLKFDDVDGSAGMTTGQAYKVHKFLDRAINTLEFDRVIVQCEAGQSRSAGVAAALMKFYNGDDFLIFGSPRYTPNMRCYRTMLEEMYR